MPEKLKKIEVPEQKPKFGGDKTEFFEHVMDKETSIGKVQDKWVVYIPRRIVSSLGLENGMSCRLRWEGGSLVMTPLDYTAILVKVGESGGFGGSLMIVIPENLLIAGGLKLGDYAVWKREEGQLSLRKAERGTPGARKIQPIGDSLGIVIPKDMARKEGIKIGTYMLLTFDKDENGKPRLWLEVGSKIRDVSQLIQLDREEYGERFQVYIPKSMRGGLSIGDELLFEPKGGELYIRKKQS